MPITITASVGRNGVNGLTDVLTIGAALVAAGPNRGGVLAPTLSIEDLASAIEKFQRFHSLLQNPDGRVDPGGVTLRRLDEVVNGSSSSAKPGGDLGDPGVTVTVSGFSRHRIEVLDLPLDQQLAVEGVAHAIVNSLLPDASKPVSGVVVTGHSDSDAQGPGFEMQVSVDRASNVLNHMRDRTSAIAKAKGLNPDRLNQIAWSRSGAGAQRKISEEDRAANRRVDISITFRGGEAAVEAHMARWGQKGAGRPWRDGLIPGRFAGPAACSSSCATNQALSTLG